MGLHSDIKAQISAKLQSLDTKEKLLMAAAEIEAVSYTHLTLPTTPYV